MGGIRIRTAVVMVSVVLSLAWAFRAESATVNLVPSVDTVKPGEVFTVDVVVGGIPEDGLNCVQFRLNVDLGGESIVSVPDLAAANGGMSIVLPMDMTAATPVRSGLGEFFCAGTGPNGVLAIDNESMVGNTALFTYAHTYGATLPSGGGSMARFVLLAGDSVSADNINLSLDNVVLLDGGVEYPVTATGSAIVQLRCETSVPDLAGLEPGAAAAQLEAAGLVPGNVSEVQNDGTMPLGVVVGQSAAPGTTLLCDSVVDIVVNFAPQEVSQLVSADVEGDDTGAALLGWSPSTSEDTAGYRIYMFDNGSYVLVADLADASASAYEAYGLEHGVEYSFKVASYDLLSNESPGAEVAVSAMDDVPPVIAFENVFEGGYYATDILPEPLITDSLDVVATWTLNGEPYSLTPITEDGDYILAVSVTDAAGNTADFEASFTLDKTPPTIVIGGFEDGRYYNSPVSPAVTVDDASPKSFQVTLNDGPFVTGQAVGEEGVYTVSVHAEDLAGNMADLSAGFAIDITAPASIAAVSVPKVQTDSTLYITSDTEITVAAVDSGAVQSGPQGVEYALDGGDWNVYEGAIKITADDGSHVLGYRSTDGAGNVEPDNVLEIVLDNSAPVTGVTLGEPRHTDPDGVLYLTGGTVCTLDVAEALSGTASTEYRVDTGEWLTYAPFRVPDEGTHTVEYRSADNLGNMEDTGSLKVVVDNSAPVTDITLGEPRYEDENGLAYVTGGTVCTFGFVDTLSGVASTEYRIDEGEWLLYEPFTVTGEGSHTVEYRSTDNLGNPETAGKISLVVDDTAPATVITLGEPRYTDAGVKYMTKDSLCTLDAVDNRSGIASTEYRIDGGEWSAYAPFTVPVEGTHTVEYRSKDSLGNLETAGSLSVEVDNSSPTNDIAIAEPRYTSPEGVLYITGESVWTISAQDARCGVASKEYRIDDGEWSLYAPFTVQDEGAHTVEYRSKDNLGNQSAPGSMPVVVDNSAPVTTYILENEVFEVGDNNFIDGDVKITLYFEDDLSGVAATYYSVDGGDLVEYSTPFILSGLDPGDHSVDIHSVDNLGNVEDASSFGVIVMALEVSTSVADVPRLLVYSDGGVDKDGVDLDAWMDNFVSMSMNGMDAYWKVVHDKDEFVDEFRSGIYNVYAIIDESSPFNDIFISELKESVRGSGGLLVSGWGNNVKSHLEELLGVDFAGSSAMSTDKTSLMLVDGPASAEGDMPVYGRVLKTELAGGTLAGVVMDEAVPNPVTGITLDYTFNLSRGDLVEVSLLGSPEVDYEQKFAGKLPDNKPADSASGQEANLVIDGLTAKGVTLTVIPNGYVEQDYMYTVSLRITRSGEVLADVQVELDASATSPLSAGMDLGELGITSVERENKEKIGAPGIASMPGLVMNEFGLGRTAFMSFNLADSARAFNDADYSALFASIVKNLHSASEGEAVGPYDTLLLETSLTMTGMDIEAWTQERFGEHLEYVPLFGLVYNEPLIFEVALEDGVTTTYRYFVRTPDIDGTYKKLTDVYLNTGGNYVYYDTYEYPVEVATDTFKLCFEITDRFGSLADANPSEAGAIKAWLEGFNEAVLLPDVTREDLDKKIHDIVILTRRLDRLAAVTDEDRHLVNRYLSLLETLYTSKQ